MFDSHRWTGFFLSILNALFIHVQKDRIEPLGEATAMRPFGLIQVGEMAEALPGFVRAGRPRSQEAVRGRQGERKDFQEKAKRFPRRTPRQGGGIRQRGNSNT